MIDPDGQSPDVSVDTGQTPRSYRSFAEVKQKHFKLREGERVATDATELQQHVREFLLRVSATGLVIADKNERRALQAILDYWGVKLATAPNAIGSDFLSLALAPFDTTRAEQTADHQGGSDISPPQRPRQLIRLGAAARLWKDYDRNHGFLLYGSAIDHAAKFREFDDDIAELVAASEERQRAKRKLWWAAAATAALSVASTIGFLYFASSYLCPNLSKRNAADLANPTLDHLVKERRLWWQTQYQRVISAEKGGLNLSKAILDEVKYPRLHLQSAKFLSAYLSSVNFAGAELLDSSFVGSTIERSDFSRANLKYGDFRDTEITSSSFAGTSFYQGVFDGSRLCGVDFSGADLHYTSFRRVRFDIGFQKRFKDTAWWLAAGWDSDQIRELQNVEQSEAALKRSKAFREVEEDARNQFTGAPPGTFGRARALNGLAWTFATWGINLTAADNEPDKGQEYCRRADDIPETAMAAARQAVCIIQALNQENLTGVYKNALASFEDTLGYILLQTNQVEEANKHLEAAQAIDVDDGGFMFRYAIAQYAIGDQKNSMENKQKAQEILQKIMNRENYIPSYELHNLARYLRNEPLSGMVFKVIDLEEPRRRPAECGVVPR